MDRKLKNDIIQWDVKTWSLALNFWEQNVVFFKGMKALELGGREGGLSLWLAQKEVVVVCSDLKDVEQTAKPLHDKHQITNKITYQDISALDIPYENHFDVIVFKSIIGGIGAPDKIERQIEVFKQIHKALKPGGKLLFAENMLASKFHLAMRKKYVKWGNNWRYIELKELEIFLDQFSKKEIKTTGFLATFGRSNTQRNFLSYVDTVFFNWWLPKSTKYIAFGIAQK
jgi:2-polyprenyl-3-methyl-5-hydroxy-6-metoxy-1,4-benzoquinol methylase